MNVKSEWHPDLQDPSGCRSEKPRTVGRTMVIDKGLGIHAFEDLLQTAGEHIDMIKIGFGTPVLYPYPVLKTKVELARSRGISIFPGGTFLEVAVAQRRVGDFFRTVQSIGFSGVEVSDGTIELGRDERSDLIRTAREAELLVYTEYGKKVFGSAIETKQLSYTVSMDLDCGAELVTIEGRESGVGVGIYDASGNCRDDQLEAVLAAVPHRGCLLWEAPLKEQQVHLIRRIGAGVNLGNIAPTDILALEALRRGLRSDTFVFADRARTADQEQQETAWCYEI
ncbi:phosphosulfolactate synthase [Paenibacillus cymbidii]|uniref:phosphosulfolactate synthase n=1 Tax=Paenibacillus cymbidii TaxID=1639034 RepID=UPI0010811222|nr:phosphosulfolactate synthase [Paenibacillus cymbidii]